MKIHVQDTPRSNDDALLSWLADRCSGTSANKIAARRGVAKSTVIKATNAVFADDLKYSGEYVGAIYQHYWGA